MTVEDAPVDLVGSLGQTFATIDQQWIAKAESAGLKDAATVLTKFRAEFTH